MIDTSKINIVSEFRNLFHILNQYGLNKTEALEVLLSDGLTPMQLSHFFASPSAKPSSIRREASRLKQRILSNRFVSFSKNHFRVNFELIGADLSLYNNNIIINTEIHSPEEIVLEQEPQGSQDPEQKRKDGSRDQWGNNRTQQAEISDEIVSDAKFMVDWFVESHVQPTLENAVTAIVSVWPKNKPYDSELVRSAIRAVYPSQPTSNAAGLVRTVLEYRLKVTPICRKTDATQNTSDLDISSRFAPAYIKHLKAQCTSHERGIGREIDSCEIVFHRLHNDSYVAIYVDKYDDCVWEGSKMRKRAIVEALRSLNLPSRYTVQPKRTAPTYRYAEAAGSY